MCSKAVNSYWTRLLAADIRRRNHYLYIVPINLSGPRVKLVSCKSALNPPVVCSTDRSKAVVLVLVLYLLLCGLFYEAICCMSFRVSFCSCVFQSF